MRQKIVHLMYFFTFLTITLSACKKESLPPPVDPVDQQPHQPVETVKIKLQAVVTIGSITYDSIPAQFSITSWDANDLAHHKDTLLAAGVNIIHIPKAHKRFKFSMSKWGISDTMMLNRQQLQEDLIYTLGGYRAAKKLRKEESFLFVLNSYQPSSKINYSYGVKGITAVEFYQKKPQHSELQYIRKNLYDYSGSNIARINAVDEVNAAIGFTDFTYNAQGSAITHIHQKLYDVETFAAVSYARSTGLAEITIDYLYNNGQALEYKMKIKRGNKVDDQAISSTGGGEGGTYSYDFNINPFVHMNMPDIYLSNLSKNNVVDEHKNYSGNIPSAVVYKYEYSYDNEGYPVEVVKHYKNYQSGGHLYKTKTIYTYM